ncbi:thiol:disulfide interchange protein DsbG [Yokenella regensburgei]|jgi:thiol:disulfide interchange protein DsbG|uniref:Thiol:disulfide interchange protein n=1 Tax=Yokenella regensburgei TaxID=158877 RepID=A0AB38FQX6_9ENTR|nr:thiol:disulfide interchange protein DsbG [Yokenella regensburgei]KFD23875.1 thiol:disulfide interchange protein [Yokenella regensburgei ATCC 49455]MDR2218184.1 thiol:disulfide interchange protein DsbG [Yokenella regensburgei]QIU87923.1 thiol:disulfide interchange protein DsbG [Yokenella regensburgei]SQA59723.1 Thiol:disulfide interchange protein DsbG precursor [Yokenella regensburgei]SQA68044.1 Thiol:disulfide interchange protein DsbG precursor [Yokenella regensburgei]
MLKHVLLLSLLPGFAFAQELPDAVKAIEKQGITIIKPFDAPGGMKGYLGKYQDMGVTIYVTPDGKHAISGYMYDEKGSNLSEKIIQKEIYAPAGRELWQRMEKASWILDGKKDAPQIIYVFADPFCPYCKQFWQQARPWVESGKVQLRTLMVGVIKPESPATAAAIMSAKDPSKTWHDYEQSGGKLALNVPAAVPPAQMKILNENQHLMDALGANATPAIYYMNNEKELQQVVGLPDAEQLKAMLGEKP